MCSVSSALVLPLELPTGLCVIKKKNKIKKRNPKKNSAHSEKVGLQEAQSGSVQSPVSSKPLTQNYTETTQQDQAASQRGDAPAAGSEENAAGPSLQQLLGLDKTTIKSSSCTGEPECASPDTASQSTVPLGYTLVKWRAHAYPGAFVPCQGQETLQTAISMEWQREGERA